MTSISEPLIVSSGKRDLVIQPPLMNAAGFLDPTETLPPGLSLDQLGALVLPPHSLRPRSPARDAGAQRFPGGFLLHSGHPNGGVAAALERFGPRWSDRAPPRVMHLLSDDPAGIERALVGLESHGSPAAVEIGLEQADPASVDGHAALAAGAELPVILRLPLDAEPEAFLLAEQAGARALSMGPPRGRLARADGQPLSGRLYGPSLLPQTLSKVDALAPQLDIPLIAAGGLYRASNVLAVFEAGAAAVQLDGVLWTNARSILELWDPD